jgi:hypothetical protein
MAAFDRRTLRAPLRRSLAPESQRRYDPGQPGTVRPSGTERSLIGADRSPATCLPKPACLGGFRRFWGDVGWALAAGV